MPCMGRARARRLSASIRKGHHATSSVRPIPNAMLAGVEDGVDGAGSVDPHFAAQGSLDRKSGAHGEMYRSGGLLVRPTSRPRGSGCTGLPIVCEVETRGPSALRIDTLRTLLARFTVSRINSARSRAPPSPLARLDRAVSPAVHSASIPWQSDRSETADGRLADASRAGRPRMSLAVAAASAPALPGCVPSRDSCRRRRAP